MKVYLRALELSDVEKLVKWRNDLEVTSSLGGNTFFISKFRETEWVKNAILNDDRNIKLAICLKENDEYIGNVNLSAINWINRSAEYSIMIGDKNQWSKGLGKEATLLILKYAFQELNLHRIYLTVRNDNERALSLYRKTGFTKEGVLRKSIYKNNKFIDMVVLSILRDEFNG
jgi:RimJ/RimL family protein N-acetyltransferase